MVKDDLFLNDLGEYCIDELKKIGSTSSEVIVAHSISDDMLQRNGKIEEVTRSEDISIGLTAYVGKRKSSISTSNLTKNNIQQAIIRCYEMAKNTPEDKYCGLPENYNIEKNHIDLDLFDNSIISFEAKKNYISECEAEALAQKKIVNSNGVSFTEAKSNFILKNSNGFSNGRRSSIFSISCDVVAKKEENMERDYEYSSKRFFCDLMKPKLIGKIAAERASARLNPKKIDSFNGPAVFEPRVASSFLSHLISSISGHNLARKVSFINGDIGEILFEESINVIDDPLIKKGLGSRNFDSEGVNCEKLQLIKNGRLNQMILDTYSSKMLNKKSNGRCGGTTNCYFENGKLTKIDLIKDIKKGVYITELFGSGFNSVTGDFSKGGSGFLIENGEITYPISEITVAGNIKDMFKKIILANDLEFKSRTNSPTMRIDNISIAGK
jgi:PmbA protein